MQVSLLILVPTNPQATAPMTAATKQLKRGSRWGQLRVGQFVKPSLITTSRLVMGGIPSKMVVEVPIVGCRRW